LLNAPRNISALCLRRTDQRPVLPRLCRTAVGSRAQAGRHRHYGQSRQPQVGDNPVRRTNARRRLPFDQPLIGSMLVLIQVSAGARLRSATSISRIECAKHKRGQSTIAGGTSAGWSKQPNPTNAPTILQTRMLTEPVRLCPR
jgi:hypothetical protein